MITIQREKWIDCIDELMPLCHAVHSLVEKDLYGLELDFDVDLYQELDDSDVFHCIVIREDGKPIGFHWIVITPLLRFNGYSQAGTDAIYVHPDHRKHSMKLIQYSENYIKSIGCKTWALATLDPEYRGDMWQRKGFKKSETNFIKVLKCHQ